MQVIFEILILWICWLGGMGLGHLADVSKTGNWKFSFSKNAFNVAIGVIGCIALGLFGLFHLITCLILAVLGFLAFHVLAFAQRKRP